MIEASKEATSIWEQLLKIKVALDKLNAQKSIVGHRIREYLGCYSSIDGIANVSIKKGSMRFNEKLLSEEHHEIYERYITKRIESFSTTFTLKGKKTLKSEYPEVYEEKKALSKIEIEVKDIALTENKERNIEIENLHASYLSLQKDIYTKDWEYTQLEAKLKVHTDNSDGINGLTGWKREVKSKMGFDKIRFEADYPDLHAKYCFQPEDSFAVIINSWRPYKTV